MHILLRQRRRLPLLPRLLPPLPALAALGIQAAAPAAAGAGGRCLDRQLRLPLLIEKSLDVCMSRQGRGSLQGGEGTGGPDGLALSPEGSSAGNKVCQFALDAE